VKKKFSQQPHHHDMMSLEIWKLDTNLSNLREEKMKVPMSVSKQTP